MVASSHLRGAITVTVRVDNGINATVITREAPFLLLMVSLMTMLMMSLMTITFRVSLDAANGLLR